MARIKETGTKKKRVDKKKGMTTSDLAKLKLVIDGLEREVKKYTTRLKNASGAFKKKVAIQLGKLKTRLKDQTEKYRQEKITHDTYVADQKNKALEKEKDVWTKKEVKSRPEIPGEVPDPIDDEEEGTINITRDGRYEIYRKGTGWEFLNGKYKGENFDNGRQMTVGFLGSQKKRKGDSKEFGKDEALDPYGKIKGPTQSGRPGSEEKEGTINITDDGRYEIFKNGKWGFINGKYKGENFDNGRQMTVGFQGKQKQRKGDSKEFGKDEELERFKNLKDPTQRTTPGSDEQEGTINITKDGKYEIFKNGKWGLLNGKYKGENFDNGRQLTVGFLGSQKKRKGKSKEFGKDNPYDQLKDPTQKTTGDSEDEAGTYYFVGDKLYKDDKPYSGEYLRNMYDQGKPLTAITGYKPKGPSEEFGKDEALDPYSKMAGPTQSGRLDSDEAEGTYYFIGDKLYKDDKLYSGTYGQNTYDQGRPLTTRTGYKPKGPSEEFGKDNPYDQLKGPTQSGRSDSVDAEGTFYFVGDKLYKDDKPYSGEYLKNMYDQGKPLTSITGYKQKGPSEEFGKDEALEYHKNLEGPSQQTTPGSDEVEGTFSFQGDKLFKDGNLYSGEYRGNNFDRGRSLTVGPGDKPVGDSEGFGQDVGLAGELGPDDAVDYEGNLLDKGMVSEDGTKYVGPDGKWKSRDTGPGRDEEKGTFHLQDGKMYRDGYLYTGQYTDTAGNVIDYTEGVSGDDAALEQVGPSSEFGQEENVRIEERNTILNAEIDALVVKTHNIFVLIDSAKTDQELEIANSDAMRLIGEIRHKEQGA